MNTLKKLYRDFFGLTEATAKQNPNDVELAAAAAKDSAVFKAAHDAAVKAGGNVRIVANESEIDEAKLVNGIDEYQGGVEYAVKDPAQAKEVSDDIKAWAEKKGFTIIKRTISRNGKNGYFYFRLGEDPEKDAQRVQGYFAQRLELAAFRFKVRGQANPSRELPPAVPKRPMRKI